MFGVTFKSGECCYIYLNSFGDKCGHKHKYVGEIPNTQLLYCKYHYRTGLKNYKVSEKKKLYETRAILKKEREEKINERNKLLEEKNIEREAKGLPPLKRLPIIKKKVENVVEQQNQPIQQYVPDEELIGCKAILKSGPNKGTECRCKKIEANGLCKRHSPKDKINDEFKPVANVL
jgi:hypothetical protein